MIGTIRRHQQWLWFVIIAGTIISFVYAFSPANKNNFFTGGGGNYNFGAINGQPITQDQMRDALAEARIFYRLNTRDWPDQSKDKELTQIARQRLLLNSEIKDFHIEVTPEATARYTKQLLGVNPDEPVPADKIIDTLNKLTHEGGVTLDDFDRFAKHQVGQEYLIALVGMSGKLITPKEAEVFFRRENEPIVAEMVNFPVTNYYAQTKPAAGDIEDFYTKRAADYRVPDRIEVNYIAFPASNYVAKVEKTLGTNLDDHIEQEYLQAGPAAFKDEAGTQLSPEAAKARIKKSLLQYASVTEARKEANSFMNDLSKGHDEGHPYTVDDLFEQAKDRQLAVKTTEPFDPKTPPKDLDVPPVALGSLFDLRADDPDDKDHSMLYASSPLVGTNAVYVVGLAKRIPSQVQPLADVRNKVIEDYRMDKSLELAKAAGGKFQSELEAGMSQGKTFDTMCAAQFVRPQHLTPFTLTTNASPDLPDKAFFQQVQEMAGRMRPGQATPFVPTPEGGFVLYVKDRLPPDDEVVRREMPVYLERMRDRLQIAAFNEWFGTQYRLHFSPPAGETSAGG